MRSLNTSWRVAATLAATVACRFLYMVCMLSEGAWLVSKVQICKMDDSVLAQFQSTFLLSGQVNDPHTAHPHYALYKAKKDGYGSQEARRKRFLEEQKTRRRNFADHARKIAEGGELSDDSDGEMDEGVSMDEVDKASKLVGSAVVRLVRYHIQAPSGYYKGTHINSFST